MPSFAWLIRLYRWCANCQKKAAQPNSELCPTCDAELQIALEKMLDAGQS